MRSRVLAVLKLITSSNSVGCSTGRSAGLAPCENDGDRFGRVLGRYGFIARRRDKHVNFETHQIIGQSGEAFGLIIGRSILKD